MDCLSHWWTATLTVDGAAYATAEHWMMAGKARLFGDAEAERHLKEAPDPALAKRAGRPVRGFDVTVWRHERFGVVVTGSVHKCSAAPDLRGFLLATGDRVLVEASPTDRVRGPCDMGVRSGRGGWCRASQGAGEPS
ncbi:hypothetical protein B1H18_21050 [Streptomyces tsukubensis]|uniref:NADAR domain-containing protein n=1 Tax=Streptomyces tsukubensis TaxID=83656 RepID=A0A1V4A649_9ACTN|nr:hypothetical protein B1H18_21050 [Streptomyces tsukubensis]